MPSSPDFYNSFLEVYNRPIVGFYVRTGLVRNLHSQITSKQLDFIIEALKKARITLYFFSLTDVNLEDKSVNGTYYDEKTDYWTYGKFPYPDILYVRGGPVRPKSKFYQFQEQLREMNVKKLNSGPTFNKWHVLKVLKENNNLFHHLPPTVIYETKEDLNKMIAEYKDVYVKAVIGRKGKQVMRIKETSDGLYEYSFYVNNRLSKDTVNFKALCTVIRKFFGKKKLIIQKTISLPRIDNKIYDMRAELQRTGTGELELLEILVRVSQPNSPITQHSSSYRFNDFFSSFMNYNQETIGELKSKAENVLTQIYETIEGAYGPYGEIGIDFAIDKSGKLWFIEGNSRSTKVSFFKAADQETKLKSYLNIFEYSKFLYKQQIDY
ncbi:YheC/YheD family protein [Natranaerobius thermophilus]|uniref:ATP-grasp domain-containing protein n=1 Tax=Natranaerobius thermophilus (strain ATCC BAA-1301 / DSM 18059 / JW/NM-WN-LF) TaxID=457570 RepID=B2A4H4_NATTJ|nr:YheC/YheD family protein [Natranaerobius thermophilus]ACB85151.1 conserved hypothetical protein [Natranaerobius thermophilus JW/NM-WN-LF]